MDESVQWAMDTYGMSYDEAVEFVEGMASQDEANSDLHRCPECGHVWSDEAE